MFLHLAHPATTTNQITSVLCCRCYRTNICSCSTIYSLVSFRTYVCASELRAHLLFGWKKTQKEGNEKMLCFSSPPTQTTLHIGRLCDTWFSVIRWLKIERKGCQYKIVNIITTKKRKSRSLFLQKRERVEGRTLGKHSSRFDDCGWFGWSAIVWRFGILIILFSNLVLCGWINANEIRNWVWH